MLTYRTIENVFIIAVVVVFVCLSASAGEVFPRDRMAVQKILALREIVDTADSPEKKEEVATALIEALTALVEALKDESQHVRKEAARLLGRLEIAGFAVALEEAAKKEKDNSAEYTMRTVGIKLRLLELRTTDEKVSLLLSLFERKKSPINSAIQKWAITELGELGSRRALPLIEARIRTVREVVEGMGDGLLASPRVKAHEREDQLERGTRRLLLAKRKIEILSGGPLLTQLDKTIYSDDEALRVWAAKRLAETKSDMAIPILQRAIGVAEHSKDAKLYTQCVASLKELGLDLEKEGKINRALIYRVEDG